MREKKPIDLSRLATREPPQVYKELVAALVRAGALKEAVVSRKGLPFKLTNPVDVLTNTKISAKPYARVLVEHGARIAAAGHGSYLDGVLRALAERGITEATDFLLSLWDVRPPLSEGTLWLAGEALATINDKSADLRIIDLCRRHSGRSLKMLLRTLARRRRPEGFQVLIEKLADPELVGHAINALWKYGDPAALPHIERISTVPGTYAHREKAKALEKLRDGP